MDSLAPLVPWRAHACTRLFVHLVWSTRHRAPWLQPEHDGPLAGLLERKARALHSVLIAAGNGADHVHVLLQHPPRVSVSQIAHRLKGASSWALHRVHRNARLAGGATGQSPLRDLQALVRYVREQRVQPRDGFGSEPWETSLP
jgi:REP element-mobilizing transposase RayT